MRSAAQTSKHGCLSQQGTLTGMLTRAMLTDVLTCPPHPGDARSRLDDGEHAGRRNVSDIATRDPGA
jgi:uncharacterized protein YwbE